MRAAVLQALRQRVNHLGLVLVRELVLLDEAKVSAGDLRIALDGLVREGVIEILSPLPFLVLKFRSSWSGSRANDLKNPRKSAHSKNPRYSYSFHQQAIDKSHAIAGENRGAGEGEGLLQEILVTLGESDPTTFRGVLVHYPASAIRSVLERIRATPPEKVRKSKTALFRFLLKNATK